MRWNKVEALLSLSLKPFFNLEEETQEKTPLLLEEKEIPDSQAMGQLQAALVGHFA